MRVCMSPHGDICVCHVAHAWCMCVSVVSS